MCCGIRIGNGDVCLLMPADIRSWDYTGFYSTKNDGARNYRNIERDQLDRWTPDNPAGKNPIRINNGWDRYNSTRYLYDGDYLKLKSMKVRYNLPGSWTQKFKIEHAHCFCKQKIFLCGPN